MPRKATVETESLWVPLAARCVCYSCGVHLTDNKSKNNCRLCFDVFCSKCWGHKRLLPTHYGYTDPQPVCTSCNMLLTLFVTFASRIHERGAGVVLPPRQAVMVTYCNLPCQAGMVPQQRSGGDGSDNAEKGFFAKILERIKGKDDKERPTPSSSAPQRISLPPSASSTSLASYCNLPDDVFETKNLRIRDATLISMIGWRPLNPSSALVLGRHSEVCLSLKEIVKVTLGAAPPSPEQGSSSSGPNSRAPSIATSANKRLSLQAGGGQPLTPQAKRASVMPGQLQSPDNQFNDGRVTVELRGGYSCQLLVGVVLMERKSTNMGSQRDDDDGREDEDDHDDERDRIVDFTSDPNAAKDLVDRLTALVKHCKGHFAFGNAAMALHADLCPSY